MTDDPDVRIDPADAALVLTERSRPALEAALAALREVERWERGEIEQALTSALVGDLGLRQRQAFGPLWVACTGRRGPTSSTEPLSESLEHLGRERATSRIVRALENEVGA